MKIDFGSYTGNCRRAVPYSAVPALRNSVRAVPTASASPIRLTGLSSGSKPLQCGTVVNLDSCLCLSLYVV